MKEDKICSKCEKPMSKQVERVRRILRGKGIGIATNSIQSVREGENCFLITVQGEVEIHFEEETQK